jgi:hypothetical protein
MWSPPKKYITSYMVSNQFAQKDISLPGKLKSLAWEERPKTLKDGVETHKLNRKSALVQAVTAQRTIDVYSFLEQDDNDDDDKDQEEGEDKGMCEPVDLIRTCIGLLSHHRLYL